MSLGKSLKPNYQSPIQAGGSGAAFNWVDCMSNAQGPNYALAKRLQHFRAVVAHTSGHPVSTNVAPSTATVSVVHNKMFARSVHATHPPQRHATRWHIMHDELCGLRAGACALKLIPSSVACLSRRHRRHHPRTRLSAVRRHAPIPWCLSPHHRCHLIALPPWHGLPT